MKEILEKEIVQESNVQNINYFTMRKLIIIIFTFYNFFASAQFIIDLDNLKSDYQINKYTFNTMELYGFNKTIEAYNIFITPKTLLLISVLPNLQEDNNWKKIDYNSIKEKIVTKSMLESKMQDWLENNIPDKKTFAYNLIKKVNNEYYMSDLAFAELFVINNYSLPIISSYGTINIKDSEVSIKEMEKAFRHQIPKQEFPLDVLHGEQWIKNLDDSYALRIYLSKKFTIDGDKAYQFWTFDGWWIVDGYNSQRGIDRFVYIPGKGIVGGSYDFYFAHKPKLMYNTNVSLPVSAEKLWDNIINEKIMIAKELK